MSHTSEDFGKLSDSPKYLSDQAVRTTKSGVDLGANTDQSTWDGKLEVVALGMQRDNSAEYRFAFVPTLRVLCNDTRSNLDLLTEPQNAGEDRSAGNTAFQIINFCAGFVDVE